MAKPMGVPGAASPSGLPGLNDAALALFTIGQASELLGLEVGAVRRLDEATGELPQRSRGGQRRYSRSQIENLERVKVLMQEGVPAASAVRIIGLEDEVARLQTQLSLSKTAGGGRLLTGA